MVIAPNLSSSLTEISLISILTIGDIQRAIIRHSTLTDAVSTILDRNKIYASDKDSIEHIKGGHDGRAHRLYACAE